MKSLSFAIQPNAFENVANKNDGHLFRTKKLQVQFIDVGHQNGKPRDIYFWMNIYL